MNGTDNRNLTMMTDLYQLTMMNSYFKAGTHKNIAVFDMFFRYKDKLNLAVFAGLEQFIDYIKSLRFSKEDLDFLRLSGNFDKDFLDYLKDFKFTGDVLAAEEGEIVFPHEPVLIVKAPLIEAQLIETAILNIVSHQTLIATKAARICYAAGAKSVVEFGVRRAHGPDAGIYGSRASIIGGCNGTSNVIAGQMFGIPIKGTHSHSWVLSFKSELEAFEKFAELNPDNCLLLVDTFDTLKSGVPNAIKVFNKLRQSGYEPKGIRLDSGDLAYLSKKARAMLDEAGFEKAIIFASGDLDEDIINSLNAQGARIDVYGVGTKLITSQSVPSLGGVYKLSQVEIEGGELPRMKISSSIEKMTNPGFKKVLRLYGSNGMAIADLIALNNETVKTPLILEHETDLWKRLKVTDCTFRELLRPVFKNGICVYKPLTVSQAAAKAKTELAHFWDEYKRTLNPEIYKVNISDGVKKIKKEILSSNE